MSKETKAVEDASGERDWEVIHSYSRMDAIRDGVLIDVTNMACEAGIRLPTAVTSSVWESCVQVPAEAPWQDEKGRLWDVLTMLRYGIKRNPGGSVVFFDLFIQQDEGKPRRTTLKSVCHGDEFGEPVLTVMFPDED